MQLKLLSIIFRVRTPIDNWKIESYCPQCEAWKPVSATWSWINFNKRPSHEFCSFTLFPSITNYTEPDSWAVKTFFDPLKTLKFPNIPWTIDWKFKDSSEQILGTYKNLCGLLEMSHNIMHNKVHIFWDRDNHST